MNSTLHFESAVNHWHYVVRVYDFHQRIWGTYFTVFQPLFCTYLKRETQTKLSLGNIDIRLAGNSFTRTWWYSKEVGESHILHCLSGWRGWRGDVHLDVWFFVQLFQGSCLFLFPVAWKQMKICKCSVREQGGRAAPAAAGTRCHMRYHGRHPWHPFGAAPGCQRGATKSPDPEMGPQWQDSSSSQGQIQWWWWVSDAVPCSQWQVQGQARTSLSGLGSASARSTAQTQAWLWWSCRWGLQWYSSGWDQGLGSEPKWKVPAEAGQGS